ncbi:beta-lactamase-like protein [Apiospora arundinis]|uniref:Cytochrome b b6 petb-like protein n=1 Tax=Apiospora arundinis TaxID=335852 RepID=A0ABR2IUL4_9PEZI
MPSTNGQSQGPRWLQWRAYLLSFAFAGLIFTSITLYSSSPREHVTSPLLRRALAELVSPDTLRSIERDEKLRRSYVEVVDLGTRATEWLTERYPVLELKETTEALRLHSRSVSGISAWGNLGRRDVAPSTDDISSDVSDLSQRGLGDAIGDALSNGLKSITDGLSKNVAGAGMFLGIGLGEGAASSLNLTTMEKAKAIGAKVAASSGMKNTGLNPTIESTSSGLAATLLGSVDLNSLTSGTDLSGITNQLGPAANGLAVGIGNGLVKGLNIGKANTGNPTPATGKNPPTRRQTSPAPATSSAGGGILSNISLPDIANNFGFGLVDTVASGIDLNKIKSMLGGGLDTSQLTAQLGPAALGLSSGIGNGLVNGLKINAVPPPTGNDIPNVANSFGYGLTNSVASNINISDIGKQLSSLTGGMGGALGGQSLAQILPPAASGLGKGLGQGIAVGLGAQPDPGQIAVQEMPNGAIDFDGVTRSLAFGITSRLLANGTVQKIASDPNILGLGGLSGAGASDLLGKVNIGQAAGGLARGFIQGAGDGITAMGGIKALIDGNASNATDIPLTPLNMDDSLGGAAVGLGQGAGSQGVAVAKLLVTQFNAQSAKRKRDQESTGLVLRRADAASPSAFLGNFNLTSFNISSLLEADTVSTILQSGINILSCEGVAGLALVGLGLVQSGTIDTSGDMNLTAFKDLIPKGTIHFTNGGMNNYEMDASQLIDKIKPLSLGGINANFKVNGNGIITTIVVTALHIALAIGVMLTVLPMAMGVESLQNMLGRIGRGHSLAKYDKWNNISWLFIIAPSIILVLIMGVVGRGNAGHFRSAHTIMGLLTTLLTLGCVGLHFIVKVKQTGSDMLIKVRAVSNTVLVFMVLTTSILGFTELSELTVCLVQVIPFTGAIAIGFGVFQAFSIGSTIAVMDLVQMFRKPKKNSRQNGRNDLEISAPALEKI